MPKVKAGAPPNTDIAAVHDMRFIEPMSAMALDMPTGEHPNKMPFSGVLTHLDVPSDRAPNGSKGRKVIMLRAAAEKAIPSLLGMGVNYLDTADGHDVTRKVGVITAASIDEGAVHIDGFIYASDFPKDAARIQIDKDKLGFSWEIANIRASNSDPMIINDFVFTGAAILRRDKAAYSATSLSAAAEEIDDMTKEELAAAVTGALTEALKPMTDRLGKIEASAAKHDEALQASAQTMGKVEPHAKRLDDAADRMESDGVGSGPSGHVKVLRNMSGSMRADAARGTIPSNYGGMYASAEGNSGNGGAAGGTKPKVEDDPAFKAVQDQLRASETKIADLQAAASRQSTDPQRKTISPALTATINKYGLTADSDGKMEASAVDGALKALSISDRLQVKASLKQAGLISA